MIESMEFGERGKRLHRAMEAAGLDASKLSAITGISRDTIGRALKDKNVSIDNLVTLTTTLKITVGYYLGEENSAEEQTVFDLSTVPTDLKNTVKIRVSAGLLIYRDKPIIDYQGDLELLCVPWQGEVVDNAMFAICRRQNQVKAFVARVISVGDDLYFSPTDLPAPQTLSQDPNESDLLVIGAIVDLESGECIFQK